MRKALVPLCAAALWMAACEDGPADVYEPYEGDPQVQNGDRQPAPFFEDEGEARYDTETEGGDQVGRARFCSEKENQDLIQKMVVAPTIPDVAMGLVPLWSADGLPVLADDLIGRPEDGKFCDPTIYSNALTWGPTNEIIAFINTETRLVESLVATQQYLGSIKGTFTDRAGEEFAIDIKMRERIKIDDVEWDQYTSQAAQEGKPRSWLNYENVNIVYRMVRETFFDSAPIDYDYDCVASKVCNIIYTTAEQQETPQITLLYFIDSGTIIAFSPTGEVIQLQIEPVRVAPFETASELRFGEPGADVVAPVFQSLARAACTLNLGEEISWRRFKELCIGDDNRTLDRVSYGVYSQRDAVSVNFSGVTMDFLHDVVEDGVLLDGARPDEDDLLNSITITRQLNSPFAEFVPSTLAVAYRQRLLQRLREAVNVEARGGVEDPIDADAGVPEADAGVPEADAAEVPEPDAGPPVEPKPVHPVLAYDLEIPDSLSDEPQPIEQLFFDGPSGQENWNNTVVRDVRALYNSLTPEQRAQVDPRIAEPTWIIEPYVEVVLEAFSHGAVNSANAYKVFRNTDDKRWVIGFANFIQDGVPYRLTVQYSLNYGAVTAVTISFGYSRIDEIFNKWNQATRPAPGLGQPKFPYYSLDLSNHPSNAFRLGGQGIRLKRFDRQLGTLDVELADYVSADEIKLVPITVTGTPIEDRTGYLRQVRGERFEFVPATFVQLGGRETSIAAYVEADGRIGRLAQASFKRPMNLCPGLSIGYGDYVREAVDAWVKVNGQDAYRECDLVFNYSANGNVLDGVASLTNRMSFVTVNGRAVQVDVWR